MLDRVLRHFLPVPHPGGALGARPAPTRVLVTGRFPNPTYDYYLKARLAALQLPVDLVQLDNAAALRAPPDQGTYVLVCRYAHPDLGAWIRQHGDRLSGCALFIDDDVHALVAGTDAPMRYRRRLLRDALLPWRTLSGRIDRVLAATPALAARIGPHATVLPPAPAVADILPRPRLDAATTRAVFYATNVHEGEHGFLLPIVRAALAACPDLTMEVVATGRLAKAWAALPRTTAIEPMPWPAFCEHTWRSGADIALVPLLPTRANAVRASTKKIDIARLGAAGLFTRAAAYGDGRTSGEWMLGPTAGEWTEAIRALAADPGLRARLAAATAAEVSRMAATAAGFKLPAV